MLSSFLFYWDGLIGDSDYFYYSIFYNGFYATGTFFTWPKYYSAYPGRLSIKKLIPIFLVGKIGVYLLPSINWINFFCLSATRLGLDKIENAGYSYFF
jgi:hypothetical protein